MSRDLLDRRQLLTLPLSLFLPPVLVTAAQLAAPADALGTARGAPVAAVTPTVLRYAAGRWPQHTRGSYRPHVVRRQRSEKEGPDAVSQSSRAGIVPLVMKTVSEPETGKAAASLD